MNTHEPGQHQTTDAVAEAKRHAMELRRRSGTFRTMEERGAAMVAMTNAADHLDRLADIIVCAKEALSRY